MEGKEIGSAQQEQPKDEHTEEYEEALTAEVSQHQTPPPPNSRGVSGGNQDPPHNGTPRDSWYQKLNLTDWISAIASLIGALATVVIMIWAGLQWGEMDDSGRQTDRMIRLYRSQVAQLSKQAGDTHDLALAAKAQSEQTATIAKQAVVQANAAKSVSKTASQQLTLLKEQLEATQAAVVTIGYNGQWPYLRGIEGPFAPSDPKLSIWFKNSGHANVLDVHVEMDVSVMEISEESRVLFYTPKEITPGPIPPTDPKDQGTQFDLENVIPQQYASKVSNGEATMRIEGVIRYHNGIDLAQVQEPFCYSFMQYTIFHKDRRRGSLAASTGFTPCFEFSNTMSIYRQRKSQAENEK